MSRSSRSLLALLGATSLLVLAGCEGGQSTATTCPTDNTLTAQSFGNDFMSNYCVRCHSSSLAGLARQGAPQDVNLDTVEGVRAHSKDIDKNAGASATVTNTFMPPNGSAPSVEERRQLSQWLACGAP